MEDGPSGSGLEVLAIIPARGGSKGIPRKNLALLGGKPLIAHSIESVLRSTGVTRLVVSTEDEEIAAVSRSYGAEVPFLRPAHLATDHADLGKSVAFTLEHLREQGYRPKAMVTLFPTSPFRPPSLIDLLVDKLRQGYQTVHVARPIGLDNQILFYKNGTGDKTHPLRFHSPCSKFGLRRYGVLSGANLETVFRGNYMHYLNDPIMLIDIDTPEDLLLAQDVLDNNLFDFQAV